MTNQSADTLSEKLAAEAQHAEQTRDAELNYQQRTPPGGQSVYGLRLPNDRIEQLRRVAAARGIEPSVLARSWLVEQLDRAENDRADDDVDRWERAIREASDDLRRLLDERPARRKAS